LAFCRALAERGASAAVLYDRPLANIAAEVKRGKRWEPPIFGVEHKPADWDTDILGRIHRHELSRFLWADDERWPDEVGEKVVFRFGYVDCFSPEHLALMRRWQVCGASFLNPPTFYLDSKVVMAALSLPAVRRQIAQHDRLALAVLDRSIPETFLVESDLLPRLRGEQAHWVLKFACFDRGNQAWGGRSLRIGAACSAQQWAEWLVECLRLPWPVVAQRLTPSAQIQIDYLDRQGVQKRCSGTTRLRSFFLRPHGHIGALVGGAHLTVTESSTTVAEGTRSVQTPIVFGDPL
jgi:hypothetical protein